MTGACRGGEGISEDATRYVKPTAQPTRNRVSIAGRLQRGHHQHMTVGLLPPSPNRKKAFRPAPGFARAVVLDRDGVINENRVDHVKSWAEFRFLPGVPDAIARLTEAGIRVFVFTNQAIINRGMVPYEAVEQVNRAMVGALIEFGATVEAVVCCPHRPEEDCSCRKPRPGLLLGLARRFELDLSRTVVIGDALTDVEAGQAAGCETILVLTGRGREQLKQAEARAQRGFRVAADLVAAIDLLLGTRAPTALAHERSQSPMQGEHV
jgi:D-glycero-D-manno-heptose 1,7-bisphosphate phosphatase